MIHEMPIRILFVYGTLRLGSNHPMAHRLRAGAKLLGSGRTSGVLYDLGVYPGATFGTGERGHVGGEVYAVRHGSRLVAELDYYEGAPQDGEGEMYGLVEVKVELETGGARSALSYALKRPPHWAKPVASGDWIVHTRARAARPVRR
jgi:gamma-glutamylcyclotransferase (GGCT)/AIG2-like uncharacterized protein YtfP